MAFALFNRLNKKREHIVAIDLGGRTTKAVHIRRADDKLIFTNYTLQDAPIYEKNITAELLGEHLKMIIQKLGARAKVINAAIGGADSLVRIIDLPVMSVPDMRLALKHSSKLYLQQELQGYVYDCHILSLKTEKDVPGKPGETEKKIGQQKCKVVVGGAKQELVDEIQRGAKTAGLTIDVLMPAILGPVNAFEFAHPDIFKNEVVALVDIGFKNTSISILMRGELLLNRVVNLGGDRFTAGLSESLGISYAEAESIKVGMAEEVRANLEPLITPLGRELRASIDFCEHQHDIAVSQVFVSGGSARSDFIMKCIQTELLVPCKSWNPASFLELGLPPQLIGEVEQIAPQLAVAIGTAAVAF